METKTCLTCKESFLKPKHNSALVWSKRKFCSLNCRRLDNSSRLKLSQSKKGSIPWNKGKKGQVAWNLGMKFPELNGENHHNWKGGFSTTKEYKAFVQRRRKAAKKASGGSHNIEEWKALKVKYNNMCLCCKRYEPIIKLTEDHIVPVSRGGSDDIDNIQPLCGSCNSMKHTKTISYVELL